MEEKPLTKEDVQLEYNKLVAILGEKVYRLFVPVLEFSQIFSRLLFLNQTMHKLQQEKQAEIEKVKFKEKP